MSAFRPCKSSSARVSTLQGCLCCRFFRSLQLRLAELAIDLRPQLNGKKTAQLLQHFWDLCDHRFVDVPEACAEAANVVGHHSELSWAAGYAWVRPGLHL